MDQAYRAFPLDQRAEAYIRERLDAGRQMRDWTNNRSLARNLSTLIADTIALSQGSISAFLPSNLSPDRIHDFQHSLSTGAAAIRADLRDSIRAHLSRADGNVCLFEEALGSAGDPWATNLDVPHLIVAHDIVYVAGRSNSDNDGIERLLRAAISAWPGALGIFTKAERLQDPTASRTIEPRDLAKMVEATEAIAVGAYDGDGFLVWRMS